MPRTGDKVQVKLNREAANKATAEFTFRFGETMTEWSVVERALYSWFALLTKLEDRMARGIFYGAKGFAARADMIESIIEALGPTSHKLPDFLTASVRKARQYSFFRNRIAHGEPTPVISVSGDDMAAGLRDPSRQSVTVVIGNAKKLEGPDAAIGIAQLQMGDKELRALATLMVDALPEFNRETKAPEEFLAQVRALPKEPHLEGSQIQTVKVARRAAKRRKG